MRRVPFLSRLTIVLAALSTASVLAGGCMVGPDYVRPAVEQPAAFKSAPATANASPIAMEWWRLYSDPALDELIAGANSSNQNLRQAVARVDEARALARIAAGDLYPTLSVNPTFIRQRTSQNRPSVTTGERVGKGVTFSDWLVPFDLGYELDVWGRIRRSLESANAELAASADDLGVVRLTVQTDVAQAYYTLRSLDAQSEILTQTVEAYREQVRILSVQLKNGLVNPIVLSQAEAQLQATLTQQRDVERARADEEHLLAVLCGRAAPSFGVAADPLREVSPPNVPPGLPAELLSRRPDVAEAEQILVAANAQIGVATAEFYPRFTLTSAAGFESVDVETLFNWQSRVASIAPSVSFPIFEGGKLTANLEATEARYREVVAAYTNQVLVAYGDVEDALTDVHAFADQVGTLREAVTASQEYHRLAQVQFKQGLVDYLTVIDAERTLLGNQLSLAQTVNLQMGASIHLIKALGGGWNPLSASSS
jgi:outer membrane protein, multidrug efflux system